MYLMGEIPLLILLFSAKGMIYTLVGGVDPAKILPIALDVGTNNGELLKDDMYLVRLRRPARCIWRVVD